MISSTFINKLFFSYSLYSTFQNPWACNLIKKKIFARFSKKIIFFVLLQNFIICKFLIKLNTSDVHTRFYLEFIFKTGYIL